MKSVSIIDYGMGNLLSMQRALEKNGAVVLIASNPEQILQAEKLVLPGVGAFPDGMQELEKRDMVQAIREFVKSGKTLLGVCLGMQMLFERSEEMRLTSGLGLIQGKVVKFPEQQRDGSLNKIPHVAWTRIEPAEIPWEQTFLKATAQGAYMYFVHSYYAVPSSMSDILTLSPFGDSHFCSAARYENVWGTQFHPEKSGEVGLKLFKEFLK
ncbi:MAG: imidazole glycerol phosphate synthase subunit HisH [Saprospiraceae bacterium]